MERIYLDYAATTPLDPAVEIAMQPWIAEKYGNPSSLYEEGRLARNAIDVSREILSQELGCDFGEVTFTSSGTESCNLAILGAAAAYQGRRNRILLGSSEHHAVLHTEKWLVKLGFEVEQIRVDKTAAVELDDVRRRLDENVLLVSVQHANNEFGTLQPIEDVVSLATAQGAMVHIDAIQTFGVLDLKPLAGKAEMVSVSGHKIHGPKGVGALFVKAGTKILSIAVGGGQERERRAGTENTPGIVGFGAAVRAFADHPNRNRAKLETRNVLLEQLQQEGFVPTVSKLDSLLPGHLHGRFPGISAESLLLRLDQIGVSASTGAACSSGSILPSHVMLAAGFSVAEAKQGLRFTTGRTTTVREVVDAGSRICDAVRAIRLG